MSDNTGWIDPTGDDQEFCEQTIELINSFPNLSIQQKAAGLSTTLGYLVALMRHHGVSKKETRKIVDLNMKMGLQASQKQLHGEG